MRQSKLALPQFQSKRHAGSTFASCRARTRATWLPVWALITITGGCGLLGKIPTGPHDTETSYHDAHGLQIEYPEVKQCATAPTIAAHQTLAPLALQDPSEVPSLDMTLQEAMELAVRQSPVLRRIGGTVVTTPQATTTTYDPALVAASPLLGTEAALAAFDAQYTSQLLWQTTDRPNNIQSGGVTAQFTPTASEGTAATYISELSKQTAQGARFALRHVVNYNRNNQPFRQFSSDFTGWVEAEWRQPLLQGAGTTFNRIAGPSSLPGQYNGVLIARINEDVALADFEAAVIQLAEDVETAYWDLETAYRVLEALVKGRESALQAFQYQQVRLEVGTGRRDEEAQARSQFYDFQAQVQVALGSTTGLYAAEQRLRYLIGLPATDGRLIRPSTPPTDVRVVFDWQSAIGQAMTRRVEIRRQRYNVKRRELELLAAKLNLRPRLDFLGIYRWRGLGDHLIGDAGGAPLNNLYGSITSGDYQEAQAGFEFSFPPGLRSAGVAVAHAKLNLNRELVLLADTELRISHNLSDAARQIEIAHQLMDTNYNRYLADLNSVDVLGRRYRDGTDNINFYLQAQRQLAISEVDFYRALRTYNTSIRDFHRQKGSLLAYNQVQLAEGPWAAAAAADACQVGRFLTPRHSPDATYVPPPLTSGYFDPSAVQHTTVAPSAPPVMDEPSDRGDIDAADGIETLPPPAAATQELLQEGLIDS